MPTSLKPTGETTMGPPELVREVTTLTVAIKEELSII
jgi:hypothetical protein